MWLLNIVTNFATCAQWSEYWTREMKLLAILQIPWNCKKYTTLLFQNVMDY